MKVSEVEACNVYLIAILAYLQWYFNQMKHLHSTAVICIC